jgi:tripartite ATP-independent transporter DctM subunit
MLSVETTAMIILLGGFTVMLLVRVPIALALVVSSVWAAFYLNIPLPTIGQRMVSGLNSFPLIAIPFFIFAGEIMGAGGISRRLIELSNIVVGRLRGGLAMMNVVASMFFGGISGSAVADASSIGSVMIPMMKKKGYDTDYSVGVTVSGAIQGVIIPPSHNMIIYSLAAGGVSIGALFAAGIVPGILLGLSLMITSYVMAVRRGYPKGDPIEARQIPRIVREGLLGLLTAVIIIGGIISGIFTATESAAIACVYAFVITFFVYREIPLSAMVGILRGTLRTLAMVLFLIAASAAYGYMLAVLKVPALLTDAFLAVSESPVVILLLINILLLVLGTVMDMAPLILIMTPILLPVATSIGMDPVHFGVMLVFNLAIGLVSPPAGSVLFVGCAIGRISVDSVTRIVLLFMVPMIVVLLLITYVPAFVLTVPRALGL